MGAIKAVFSVLHDAHQPLRLEEITRRVLETGLWTTKGKTPEATVHARLAVDIQRKGAQSAFQRTGRGTFALREWGLPEYTPKRTSAEQRTAKAASKAGDPQAGATPEPLGSVVPGAAPVASSAPPASAGRMSFTDAAQHILETAGGGQPMHYREMTKRAMALGLVTTAGKTPAASLYAQILTETKRRIKRGEQPRFVMHGKGFIGLAKWMGQGLAFQIGQHNRSVHRKLCEMVRAMDPGEFEELVGRLLGALGFEDVTVTARSGDGGIDVRGTLVVGDVIKTRMAVQAKRWKQNVQAPIVQQVRGSLGTHEQGLIITTSDFSSGAREEAARANAVPVGLMNGEQFVTLLMENDIGVTRRSHDIFDVEG